MKQIQVPGGEPPDNHPAYRWSQEMDEWDAIKELRTNHSNNVEDLLEFIRGDSREGILSVAQIEINKFKRKEEE